MNTEVTRVIDENNVAYMSYVFDHIRVSDNNNHNALHDTIIVLFLVTQA